MNFISFSFRTLLFIIQPDVDRVVFIPTLPNVYEIPVLTIDQTIEVMEKIQRERINQKIHGKVSRSG